MLHQPHAAGVDRKGDAGGDDAHADAGDEVEKDDGQENGDELQIVGALHGCASR